MHSHRIPRSALCIKGHLKFYFTVTYINAVQVRNNSKPLLHGGRWMIEPRQISVEDSIVSAAGTCKLQCNKLCNASFQVAAKCVFVQILHCYTHLQVVLHSNDNNMFNGPLSTTTRVTRYQKKDSLTHTLSLSLLYNISN